MEPLMRLIYVSVFASLLAQGCSGRLDSAPPDGAGAGTGEGFESDGGEADLDSGVADPGSCQVAWDEFGQSFFQARCVSCHTHDHSSFASLELVRSQAALIATRIRTDTMPIGMALAAAEKQKALYLLSCLEGKSDAGTVFEAASARAAVAKSKMLLVGLAPTDDEVKAVEADPKALKPLVTGWMALPQYRENMLTFFQLAFQQTQITSADLREYVPTQTAAADELLAQNVRESFARTALALDAEGRPFTETFTTTRFMLTPALMELYAYTDVQRLDDRGKRVDTQMPLATDLQLTSKPGPIALEDSINPASPNFMKWFHADIGRLKFTDETCNIEPIVYPSTSKNIHETLYGTVPTQIRPGQKFCPSRGGQIANWHFLPTDFSNWKMVSIRKPGTGEKPTRFYDLPLLRKSNTLVLDSPRLGFFSTPAFFVNWPTNDSNQMRATINQTMIVATGHAFDNLDNTPTPLTPGLDAKHAAAADCNSCHRLLDPTRSIFSSTWNWFYYPASNPAMVAQKGRFVFRGVDQPVNDIADFAQTLAKHPLVPAAWVQKLCTSVNSGRCDENNAEFKRIVKAFVASKLSWSTLVKELFSSPLVTRLTPSGSEEVIAIARRDQLCAALDTRLGLTDSCGLRLGAGGIAQGLGVVPRIVAGLPSDGYGRGSVDPVLPNEPTLFYRAGLENICLAVATQVIDATPSAAHPNAKQWVSTKAPAAIAEFVALLVGLPEGHPQYAAANALLQKHFTDASATQSRSDALKSTFVSACLSPTLLGVGM